MRSQLEAVPGIESCTVDFGSKTATLTVSKDVKDLAALKESLKSALKPPYSVASVK